MLLNMFKTLLAIHSAIKTEKPQLIHAITLKCAVLAGLAVRLHQDVRIIHTLIDLNGLIYSDGLKPKILRLLIGPLLKCALKHPRAAIIFQNPDDQELMIKRGFVNPAQCTLIRGSGVDLTQFPAAPLPDDATPIVLMPTRLVHDKGIAIFIEAAKILAEKGPPARFQIAGGITHNNPRTISEHDMHAMIKDTPVEWLGKVADMPALYASATLICYPSYYGEGIPKVLLESCATGRPIITTAHPGCREACANARNGLLIPIKDAKATAQAIKTLLENPEKMKEMGAHSRKRAEEEFDVNLIVENTLKVYG